MGMVEVTRVYVHRTYTWNCPRCYGRMTSPIDPCGIPSAGNGRMYVCHHCDHSFPMSRSGNMPEQPRKGV